MARTKRPLTTQKRDVSFSKRKKGFLNKAMELCILCNAQVGLIVASPTGKLTVFGHSSCEEIFDHFLRNRIPHGGLITNDHIEKSQELGRLSKQLERIKMRTKDCRNDVLDMQQWIESRWSAAQSEEEVLKVIKEFEIIKEKLMRRFNSMQPWMYNLSNNHLLL